MAAETRRRWEAGDFQERLAQLPVHPEAGQLPQVAYETYMLARLVRAIPGEVGILIVKFLPEAAEDNCLHAHPVSDRVVTVLEGSGRFVAVRNGAQLEVALEAGDRIWMPRDTLHTFVAGADGLVVESIHNPFIPLDDEQCIVYPEKERRME
jgi:quercetin dioxygenase-like cupin family protein